MDREVTTVDRSSRSRRELLAGATGAVGVIAAQGILGAKPALAGTDGDVVLGASNTATSRTSIGMATSDQDALAAFAGGSGVGVYAATSGSGDGVYGQSTSGSGVHGFTGTGNGVHGETGSGGSGVYGSNSGGGNGVYGHANNSGGSGVYGQNDGSSYGVAGRAPNGTGTLGDSTNGIGVAASTENGTGLSAIAGAGTALRAMTGFASGTAARITNSAGGTALSVTGKAKFNRSGVVSITNPAVSATVTVPGGLATASLVLAILQNAVAGVWVVRAVPNTSTGKATITLNKTPGSGTAKVAWFVVN